MLDASVGVSIQWIQLSVNLRDKSVAEPLTQLKNSRSSRSRTKIEQSFPEIESRRFNQYSAIFCYNILQLCL